MILTKMGSNGKFGIEKAVGVGNDAMDVDGVEEEDVDDMQKMEMDEDRPPVLSDGGLGVKKEERKNMVKIETGNGESHGVYNSVNGVLNPSLEGRRSGEAPLANESKNGGSPSGLAEEKDGKPDESSDDGTRMEDSAQRESEKYKNPEKLANDAGGSKVSAQNGTKKEELSNEWVSRIYSKEDFKREVEIPSARLAVRDGTKREPASQVKERLGKPDFDRANETDMRTPPPVRSFLGDPKVDGYESGTEKEQREFAHELHVFHKGRGTDFRPPKFYQEQLNLLKLWRWVIKLGGYEQVTTFKLWRQVGESFRPPKTCTTVSWTFRGFYEKTLLEYEKQKIQNGELPEIDSALTDSMVPGTQGAVSQPSGSGKARRDAAARAMEGWHALRVSSDGEVGDPIIKDKNFVGLGKRERELKSIALLKRPKQSPIDHAANVGHPRSPKPQSETMVVDAGPPADWVKINVHRTKDCYEVYALVPGLLREEVRVQSDPAGRLVISGQPEHLDNPWGITPFKKIVSLPTRIDPHQTSAVVTLHGQLVVRVPFEQSDN